MRKTLKAIKDLISRKRSSSSLSSAVIESDITLNNPQENANPFNKYFLIISSTIQPQSNSQKKIAGIPFWCRRQFLNLKPIDKPEIKNTYVSIL